MRRVIGRTNASDGSWRHVAAVLPDGEDNAEDIVLYLDGESDAAGSTVSCTIDTDNVNGSDVRLGMTNWSGHESYFDGLIDDVRLYSTDLSAAQIASLAAYHRQGFTYDKLGNRLTLAEPRDDATTTYTYDNVTNELATINSVSVTYDAAGNMTADHRGYSYAYDYENRLVKITEGPATIAEFTYDALGRRIKRVANSTTTRYYYDNWRVLAETDDQAAIQRVYVYGNYLDEALLMIDKTGQSDVDYYYVHDHLFSPAALLSDAAVVLERYEYDAYGEPRFYDKDFVLLAAQASAYGNPIMFTGQRLDRLDSGDLLLMNYKARVYDPGTGRFLQHDPLGIRDGIALVDFTNGGQPELRGNEFTKLSSASYETNLIPAGTPLERKSGRRSFSPPTQYAEGCSLYQFVKSNPLKWLDPTGLRTYAGPFGFFDWFAARERVCGPWQEDGKPEWEWRGEFALVTYKGLDLPGPGGHILTLMDVFDKAKVTKLEPLGMGQLGGGCVCGWSAYQDCKRCCSVYHKKQYIEYYELGGRWIHKEKRGKKIETYNQTRRFRTFVVYTPGRIVDLSGANNPVLTSNWSCRCRKPHKSALPKRLCPN